jgi:hypothetical protein
MPIKEKNRMVNVKFWEDKYISKLSKDGRYLFLYLLTNAYTNCSGIYEVSLNTISSQTGIDKSTILKLFTLFYNDKKVWFDDGTVVIRNFIKNQKFTQGGMKEGITSRLEGVNSKYIDFIFDAVPEEFKTSLNIEQNNTSEGVQPPLNPPSTPVEQGFREHLNLNLNLNLKDNETPSGDSSFEENQDKQNQIDKNELEDVDKTLESERVNNTIPDEIIDSTPLNERKNDNFNDELKGKKRVLRTFDENSHEMKLSNLLYNSILERDSKAKQPDFNKWALELNLLYRVDEREWGEIEKVLRWTQKNDFWKTNILSPKKLRAHFSKLKQQMNEEMKKEIKQKIPYTLSGLQNFMKMSGRLIQDFILIQDSNNEKWYWDKQWGAVPEKYIIIEKKKESESAIFYDVQEKQFKKIDKMTAEQKKKSDKTFDFIPESIYKIAIEKKLTKNEILFQYFAIQEN